MTSTKYNQCYRIIKIERRKEALVILTPKGKQVESPPTYLRLDQYVY